MMKKVLYLRLLFAIFASMVSLPMFAYDIAVKNADGVTIYYNKWDNTLSVTYTGERDSGYGIYGNNYAGKVDIPFSVEYGGKIYSVTSIDMSAFYGCSGLTSVTIPNSVTYIGSYAFRGCSKSRISLRIVLMRITSPSMGLPIKEPSHRRLLW